jgi:hypothetical protein
MRVAPKKTAKTASVRGGRSVSAGGSARAASGKATGRSRGGGAAGAAPARQAPRIYDPDVVDRIGEVEGPRWAKMQRTGAGLGGDPAKNGTSVRAFVDAWEVLQAELAASPGTTWTDRLNPQDFGGPGSDGSIYGEGGYVVRPDGEVCLLRWSTRPEKLELAERVGFRVVG